MSYEEIFAVVWYQRNRQGAKEAEVVAWLKIILHIDTLHFISQHTIRSEIHPVLCLKVKECFFLRVEGSHSCCSTQQTCGRESSWKYFRNIKHILAYFHITNSSIFRYNFAVRQSTKVSEKSRVGNLRLTLFHLSTFFHRLYYLWIKPCMTEQMESGSWAGSERKNSTKLYLTTIFLPFCIYFLIINCHVANFWLTFAGIGWSGMEEKWLKPFAASNID